MADMSIAPEPQAAPTAPLPETASPAAYGGDVAEAGAAMTDGIQQRLLQRNEIDLRNRYDAQMGAVQVKVAQMRDSMDQYGRTLQQQQGLDPADYQRMMLEHFDTLAPAVTDGVTNPHILNQISTQIGTMRAQEGDNANAWAMVQQAQMANALHGKLMQQLEGQSYATRNLRDFLDIQDQARAAARSLQFATPAEREAAEADAVQRTALQFMQGMAYSDNPQDVVTAKALIENGGASALGVPGSQLHVVERLVNGRIAVLQRAAETQAAMAKADLNQQISLMETGAQQGLKIDPQLAAQLHARAMAMGEKTQALKLEGIVADQGFADSYRAMTPLAIQQRVSQLSALNNPSASDQRELAWAREHAGRLTSEFMRDPVGYLASNGPSGTQPPQLNGTDGASFAARARWAAAASQAMGQPVPPLSNLETETFAKQMQAGDQGRIDLLSTLDNFDPVTRAAAVQQIAPHDGAFAAEAQVLPSQRAQIQRGKEALRANPAYWPRPNDYNNPDQATQAQAMAALDANAQFALRRFSPDAVKGYQDTARNWLAGLYAAKGLPNAHGSNASEYLTAMAVAMGGHVQNGQIYGGLGNWNNRAFSVPEWQTGQQFQQAASAAAASDVRAGRGPVDARSGKTFNLSMATPTLISTANGERRYVWETQGGTVMQRGTNGKIGTQPYVTVIRQH